MPKLGKLCLFSNNGSLYLGKKGDTLYFSSESFPLRQLHCDSIEQVRQAGQRVTLYSSSEDLALKASKQVNGGPRAGDSGDGMQLTGGQFTLSTALAGNDLPLLQVVDKPYVVNPDPTLLAHAQQAGWPILNWR